MHAAVSTRAQRALPDNASRGVGAGSGGTGVHGLPITTLPVFICKHPLAWAAVSVYRLRITHRSSACFAVCDNQYPNAAPGFAPIYACACTNCATECVAVDPCNH